MVADSGVENVNHEVDRLLDLGRLRRVLAQVEVVYSNSMIEVRIPADLSARSALT
ncbi:MAG: hypothetical protein JW751_05285 [Polyangiaceae bacterium]|nr:hypothetical protein [Polyangiaceae bacterium]